MRLLIALVLMLSLSSCKSQKNKTTSQQEVTTAAEAKIVKSVASSDGIETTDSIIYTESTRGYFLSVVQSNDVISVTKTRNGEALKLVIDEKDVLQLKEIVADLDLKGISRLKAPSQLRTYDAAAFAHIKIIKLGAEYKSSSFDAGNPPKELKALVDKIKTLSELVK